MTTTLAPVAAALDPAGPAATATARKLTDGTWRLDDEDWGTFTGPTLGAAYARAAAYRAGQGDTGVLVTRIRRPGSLEDWQVLDRLGYHGDEDWPATPAVNPGAPPCGHRPGCPCPTPLPSPERLDALAADWDAEIARVAKESTEEDGR